MSEEYPFTLRLNNHTLSFRKWKVKDKFNLDKAKTSHEKHVALAYNCLEDKKVCLDSQELVYVIYNIRQQSVHKPVQYTFTCTHCGKDFDYTADLDMIFKPKYAGYKQFKVGKHEYLFDEIRNAKYYDDTLDKVSDYETKEVIDMALHLKSIDRNDTMRLEDVLKFINDMDLDEYTELQKTFYDQRFSLNFTHDITCPLCSYVQTYIFDSFPGFYPTSWEARLNS